MLEHIFEIGRQRFIKQAALIDRIPKLVESALRKAPNIPVPTAYTGHNDLINISKKLTSLYDDVIKSKDLFQKETANISSNFNLFKSPGRHLRNINKKITAPIELPTQTLPNARAAIDQGNLEGLKFVQQKYVNDTLRDLSSTLEKEHAAQEISELGIKLGISENEAVKLYASQKRYIRAPGSALADWDNFRKGLDPLAKEVYPATNAGVNHKTQKEILDSIFETQMKNKGLGKEDVYFYNDASKSWKLDRSENVSIKPLPQLEMTSSGPSAQIDVARTFGLDPSVRKQDVSSELEKLRYKFTYMGKSGYPRNIHERTADALAATQGFIDIHMLADGTLLTNTLKETDHETLVNLYKSSLLLKNKGTITKDFKELETIDRKGQDILKELNNFGAPKDAPDYVNAVIHKGFSQPKSNLNEVAENLKIKRLSPEDQAEMFKNLDPQELNKLQKDHAISKGSLLGASGLLLAGAVTAPAAYYYSQQKPKDRNLMGYRGQSQLLGRG